VTTPSATTTNFPYTTAAITARAGGCDNFVMVDNVFNGNPGILIQVTNTGGYPAADGIVWLQGSGNWYAARNMITNYGLEGIQFNSGPAAAVGNIFKTLVSSPSTCALNAYRYFSSPTGADADYVFCFIGNEVTGGRYGHAGDSSPRPWLTHALHAGGNRLTLDPPFSRWDDLPGAVTMGLNMSVANVSGNKLLAGGHGVRWLDSATNAVVLKNDFGVADYRALAYDGSNGVVNAIAILKNQLNQGVSFHLKLREPDAGGFFLWNNLFTNGATTVNPFIDSATAPVHIIH
jgi:hypothetical protein